MGSPPGQQPCAAFYGNAWLAVDACERIMASVLLSRPGATLRYQTTKTLELASIYGPLNGPAGFHFFQPFHLTFLLPTMTTSSPTQVDHLPVPHAVGNVALWLKSVGVESSFYWSVPAMCAIAFVVCLRMRDPSKVGYLRDVP